MSQKKYMNQYTSYCTEQQTQKALELGAPIEITKRVEPLVNRKYFSNLETDTATLIPTTQEMIEWLEKQELFIHIDYDFKDKIKPYKSEMSLLNGLTRHCGWFVSRKEATLAAIDAALEEVKKNRIAKAMSLFS